MTATVRTPRVPDEPPACGAARGLSPVFVVGNSSRLVGASGGDQCSPMDGSSAVPSDWRCPPNTSMATSDATNTATMAT